MTNHPHKRRSLWLSLAAGVALGVAGLAVPSGPAAAQSAFYVHPHDVNPSMNRFGYPWGQDYSQFGADYYSYGPTYYGYSYGWPGYYHYNRWNMYTPYGW